MLHAAVHTPSAARMKAHIDEKRRRRVRRAQALMPRRDTQHCRRDLPHRLSSADVAKMALSAGARPPSVLIHAPPAEDDIFRRFASCQAAAATARASHAIAFR